MTDARPATHAESPDGRGIECSMNQEFASPKEVERLLKSLYASKGDYVPASHPLATKSGVSSLLRHIQSLTFTRDEFQKAIAAAVHEASTCDDIPLSGSLAHMIRALQKDRADLRAQLQSALSERDEAKAQLAAAPDDYQFWLSRIRLGNDLLFDAESKLDKAKARVGALEEAVRWALGEDVPGPEFTPRPPGAPAYWWRKELRQRAFSPPPQGEEA